MITYEEVCAELKAHEDKKYRDFHKKLLKNECINVIGVRTPVLRSLAKEWKGEWENFRAFPDEYYEITFLKCTLAGQLPFGEFCMAVQEVVPLLDNWATCDCFTAPTISKHKEEFLPFVREYLADEREFVHRFGLVTLLHYYVEETYLPLIFGSVKKADGGEYYVMMAAAWLLAEALVKFYGEGVKFLREAGLGRELNNKAIQKARESFRLTEAQKNELKTFRK